MKKILPLLLLVMMGMPFLHGLSGKDFGQAVSALAKTYPGAVADHVHGM